MKDWTLILKIPMKIGLWDLKMSMKLGFGFGDTNKNWTSKVNCHTRTEFGGYITKRELVKKIKLSDRNWLFLFVCQTGTDFKMDYQIGTSKIN